MDVENKFKVKISLMERFAEIIIIKLNSYLNKEGIELKKMKLGIEIILINLSKFIIIFFVAARLNLLKETLFMTLVFASIRKSSFGLHANNSIICTIISLIIFVFGPYISYYIKLNNYLVFIIFVLINLILYKYAPADTVNHPLLGKKLRKRLRKQSVIAGLVLMILALIIPNQSVKAMIIISVVSQILSILPITYKILNRGYKNYEKYERADN